MSWVVHKHVYRPEPGRQKLVVPEGSKILSVQNQYGRLTVWFQRVEPTDSTSSPVLVTLDLLIVETGSRYTGRGELAPNNLDFLGTVQFDDEGESYVLHVFLVRH